MFPDVMAAHQREWELIYAQSRDGNVEPSGAAFLAQFGQYVPRVAMHLPPLTLDMVIAALMEYFTKRKDRAVGTDGWAPLEIANITRADVPAESRMSKRLNAVF